MLERIFGLGGQVGIVTGGGTGIGRAIAIDFAAAGAAVVVAGRRPELLAETVGLVEAAGGRAVAVPCDVADDGQVERLVAATLEAFGRVDVLVNNAGSGHPGQVAETSLDDWDRVQRTNLRGAFACTKAVFPLMRDQGSGCVINIASVAGQTGGVSASAPYAASKGGLIAFTKALARQMAAFGGRANAVAPGQIDTRMGSISGERLAFIQSITPLRRLGRPEEIAHAVLFLASPAASFITGETLSVNGGILMD